MSSAWLKALAFALTCSAASAQTIHGVTEESPRSHLRNGKVVGPATDLVEASLRRAGLTDYRLDIYPWARAYDMALAAPNVLIYLIGRTPARETQFKWVGEVMRSEAQLYKLRRRTDVVVRQLDDAKRYTVGTTRGDVRQDYLVDRGFTKLVVSAHGSENFKRLLSGQVELVPMSAHDARQLCDDAHLDFAVIEKALPLDGLSIGLYLAYSRSTDDGIVARTRVAFEQLKADGTLARLMSVKP